MTSFGVVFSDFPGIEGQPCDPVVSFPVDLSVELNGLDAFEGAPVILAAAGAVHATVLGRSGARFEVPEGFNFQTPPSLWIDVDRDCQRSDSDRGSEDVAVDFVKGLAMMRASEPIDLAPAPHVSLELIAACEDMTGS